MQYSYGTSMIRAFYGMIPAITTGVVRMPDKVKYLDFGITYNLIRKILVYEYSPNPGRIALIPILDKERRIPNPTNSG